MKTINLVLAFVIIFSGNVLFAQKVQVNTKKSNIVWHGEKVLGKHEGNIQLKSGSFEIKNDQFVSGNFVVDMTSITNTDLTDQEYNQKLVGHLKSDDFFGVEKYPTSNFVLTKSSKFKDGKATVTGVMTIKANSETMSFDVMKDGNEYKAKIEIDRSKYDVRYGSNSFFDNLGDKAIDDIFTLDVTLAVE